ncbi:MAG TPA: hypothetical protein VN457_00180 [Chlamydiales bacterium]|nr:hypothetical protein [Chlamydiales bacterium]
MDAITGAKEICKELKNSGHTAYFAGGYVRDLLLGTPSDDIDIATDASPDEIAALFPDHVLVGAQFGVVLVLLGAHQYEVASFRKDLLYIDGRKPTEISLKSTPREDAERRDFTINCMFFDPETGEIHDFCEGQKDLEKKIIRAIGNPVHRFEEDRLRMIRCIRFAARLGFEIEPKTRAAISSMAHTLIPAVSMERIFQELNKMRSFAHFKEALLELHSVGLLQAIFPLLKNISLETLKKRLTGVELFSKNVPTSLFLVRLFDEKDTPFLHKLHRYIKASNEDGTYIQMYLTLLKTDLMHASRHTLARLMADPHFAASFEAIPLPPEITAFVRKQQNALVFFIDRLQKKEPLVTSKDLLELGILPGKEMGRLLKVAEEVAINENILEKKAILDALKRDHLKS